MTSPDKQALIGPVLRIFWRYTKGYRGVMLVIALFIIVADLTNNVITPLYAKKVLDALTVGDRSDQAIVQIMGLVMALIVTKGISWSMWRGMGFLTTYFQASALRDLQEQSFGYLMRHSYQFFSNAFAGGLVKKVNRLASSFEEFADTVEYNAIPFLTTLIGAMVVIFTISKPIALLFALWIVLFILFNLGFARWKIRYDVIRSTRDSEATEALADAIGNHTTVLAFAGVQAEQSRYFTALNILRRARVFSWNLGEINLFIHGILTVAIEAVVLVLSIRLWRAGQITIGDFVLFQGYFTIMVVKLRESDRIIRRLSGVFSDAKEMVDILNQPHEIQDRAHAKQLKAKTGMVVFEDVSFAYQARPVLQGFSLAINTREKIAFVGSSGAGKTTIVKLLLRFYEVTQGKILIDGQSIAHVTQDSLHEQIAFVPQEPVLFHRSLLENIRYGRPDATEAEVRTAAKKAHCAEFIESMPDGYQTFVGERGVKLSGGERQRVAIARAILKNAPILVLDEATSSLDSESEALIQDALETLMKEKTVIAIAHRLSTVMRMDRIIEIEHGRVVNEGTHEDLLRTKGMYHKLWNIQVKGFTKKKEPLKKAR